ncbi:sensor histidine kinase [Gracilinema caldarium]|uniref:ATP-binding region ATPase domain protein n=1 Tax=Gracilinema caldarium (strain ATCC 51460 / DSM 7334 / H1) TaxID=744872 RepID=F8F290_GRAC1|nr:sensor histidine kinase [Gracilinema caldarium]AEJ20872.1 ATP-binding region ATPase domain protein [Gracilinema caldarium DSM 7334]
MHFTVSDLVLDIVQNAAEAQSNIVTVILEESDTQFRFTVQDDGKGMTSEELQKALDPFHTDGIKHPHRKVGLGLPFLVQTAEQCGGGWDITSQKGQGTMVSAWFDLDNVDTPPLGDIPGLIRMILLLSGPKEFVVRRSLQRGGCVANYEVRKTELLDVLGDLEEAGSQVLLDQYLRSLEAED